IDLVAWHPPDVSFRATVSPGTYLRAIGRDLGDRLGVGAHLVALRREAIGPLRVEDAVPPGQITPAALLPPDRVLRHLPAVELDLEARRAVAHGQAVRSAAEQWEGGAVMLMGAGQVVAVAEARDGWLRPTVVLAPA
ncbi:MAG: tRNA pseudouridine(55) synthase TruB, partial [Gemmatimonadales bacterium]